MSYCKHLSGSSAYLPAPNILFYTQTYFCSSRMSKTLSASHRFLVEMSPPIGHRHTQSEFSLFDRHKHTYEHTNLQPASTGSSLRRQLP